MDCTDTKPQLSYKLTTDPEGAGWVPLTSPDDWADAINEVRNKKVKGRGKPRRSVDIVIGIHGIIYYV